MDTFWVVMAKRYFFLTWSLQIGTERLQAAVHFISNLQQFIVPNAMGYDVGVGLADANKANFTTFLAGELASYLLFQGFL
jgi:hypothetical protein